MGKISLEEVQFTVTLTEYGKIYFLKSSACLITWQDIRRVNAELCNTVV